MTALLLGGWIGGLQSHRDILACILVWLFVGLSALWALLAIKILRGES